MSMYTHIHYTHEGIKTKKITKLGLNCAFNSVRYQLVTVIFFSSPLDCGLLSSGNMTNTELNTHEYQRCWMTKWENDWRSNYKWGGTGSRYGRWLTIYGFLWHHSGRPEPMTGKCTDTGWPHVPFLHCRLSVLSLCFALLLFRKWGKNKSSPRFIKVTTIWCYPLRIGFHGIPLVCLSKS